MKTKFLLISLLCIGLLSCEKDNKRENDKNTPSYIKNGALPGVFSVSDTKQVKFSQGNLQYQASTDTWRFAENQYDYVNNDVWSGMEGWGDLFRWGTYNNPTNTGDDYEDYSTFVDWGVNKISNGGNKTGLWRTLTADEWAYISKVRNRATSLRGKATINGTFKGVVILPDNWKDTDMFVPGGDYNSNEYTFSDWKIMESKGAVFFYSYWDSGDAYWTSSVVYSNFKGKIVPMTSGGGDTYYDSYYPVRLVQDVK